VVKSGANKKILQAEKNRKDILELLVEKRELTILEISRELEISVPTVSKNVRLLITDGIVENAGVSESTGGRRPMLVRFLPDAFYSVGVEFSMEYIRIVLMNLVASIKTDRVLSHNDFRDMDGVMSLVRQEVETILSEDKVPASQVLGIGFSLPGTVNEKARFLKLAPNLGLKNVDFTHYKGLFEYPLFIENEANAAAFAELKLGRARGMLNLVYVSILPKGIGTGVVVGGHLYRGENRRAGEYGHTTVASHGRICSCGRKDCWELYASGNVLLTAYEAKNGKHLKGTGEFFTEVEQGNPVAAEVLDTYLEYLAVGIQDIILVQDPHYVIIGGVLNPFQEHFLEALREKVFVENNFYDSRELEIMCSDLQADASILGVALLAIDRKFPLYNLM
jgi:predicted NBD/HSP70 family sugar kinase